MHLKCRLLSFAARQVGGDQVAGRPFRASRRLDAAVNVAR